MLLDIDNENIDSTYWKYKYWFHLLVMKIFFLGNENIDSAYL